MKGKCLHESLEKELFRLKFLTFATEYITLQFFAIQLVMLTGKEEKKSLRKNNGKEVKRANSAPELTAYIFELFSYNI